MIKKYYDKNNYIVGTSFGELTLNEKETNIDCAQQIMGLLNSMPQKKGYRTHLLEDEALGFVNYSYIYEKIPESEWSDELIKEMFQEQIMNSITIDSRPAKKEGYNLKPIFNGNSISWEFVKENNNSSIDSKDNAGTYLDPIVYTFGMSIITGKWYTDNDNIWEAIKDGIPKDFNDKEYFDII